MISVASGVEGTGATAIRQPNASRLTASGARSGGRLGGILQPLDSPSIRASSLGLKPRSTKSPATTSASMRKATSCSMEGWKKSLSPLRQSAIDLGTPISRQTMPKTGAVR